jgi:hypothetical protein
MVKPPASAALLLAVASLTAAAGCYRPAPPNGALLCSLDGQCPDGYHCASDSTCWRTGSGPDVDGGDDTGPPFSQAPRLISPRNGASTGTARAALSRRPLFRWKSLREATRYEVQVDDSCDPIDFRSCSFTSPEAAETATTPSLRVSAGLSISLQPPVGRRYYWRVRGCDAGTTCTPWSEVRYIDVGRNRTDYTGDGDSDLAVGNAGAEVNGIAAVGGAYIIPGAGSSTLPGLIGLTSKTMAFGDKYGTSAASAGDLNGDGYADLAVSAELVSQGGRIYLYLGGPNWPYSSSDPSQTLPNPEAQDVAFFGQAMASGDLNGDGRSDLVIGAPSQDGAAFSDGKVFVYTGDATAPGVATTPALTLENPAHQEQGYFGGALAVGDFDGDGYADVAIAAKQQDAVGRVFLYRGGPTGLAAAPAATLDDPKVVTGAAFGYSLAAGDFDGDGYADLVVAAALEDTTGGKAVGRVFVYHGGAGGIADRAAPWRTLDNPTNQALSIFGWAMVAADFNADDIDDLVISAGGQDTQTGRIYVYPGAAGGLADAPSRTLDDPPPIGNNDFFGYVLGVGDRAPADGYADLFVGALRGNGVIYLYDGAAAGLPETGISGFAGAQVQDDIGPSSISTVGP